jgi:hypothetical protein
MPTFSRDEIHAAWKRRMELQDADDWAGFGNTFTADAVYHEHHYGVFRGREKILAWLVPVMEYAGWTYRRVGLHRRQPRRPQVDEPPAGQRPDGSFYEFAGITAMEYAGNGQFSFQEDIYNRFETDKIIDEWKAATGGQYIATSR